MLLRATPLLVPVSGAGLGKGRTGGSLAANILAVPEIVSLSPHSFGLKIYCQLVRSLEGGKGEMEGKREGAWRGVFHLVGNGQSCEAVGNREVCGPVLPALPWCANMGQAVGGQGSWGEGAQDTGFTQPDFIAQGSLKPCGVWEQARVLILGLSTEDPKLLGQSANLPLRGSQVRVPLRVPRLGRVESGPTCSPAHDLALATSCTEESGTCQLAYLSPP